MSTFGPALSVDLKRASIVTSETPQPPHKYPHLFDQLGVREAPTLYPSEEEFADPHKFLQANIALGERYGILKIVPPHSWKPGFSLDPETYTFTCRKQEISSLGVVNRTAKDYSDRLRAFHAMAGRVLGSAPTIDIKAVPYHDLNHCVQSMGGIKQVDTQNRWPEVAFSLGVNIAYAMTLRQIYFVDIQPFETYCEQVRIQLDFLFAEEENEDEDDDESDDEDEDEDEESESEDEGKLEAFEEIPPYDPEESCMICHKKDTQIGCYRCQSYAHVRCIAPLSPGLQTLPKWMCPKCIAEPSRFYFNKGKSYTLNEFSDRANKFKAAVLKSLGAEGLPSQAVEGILEKEFWSIVEGARSNMVVEYGAEIRCDEEGSGFPTKGTYKDDPWNLNNLPFVKESLFKYLDESISGVTVPWAYVGMLFSAFCWHTEDNFCYSINYQHFGDPKTWYGIPADNASRFEKLSEWLAPEAFKEAPDLLNERSCLVSPGTLTSHGIPVFGANQRPGEFIVTFPNVYHAGFNQGYNFNEAVNYTPPDWVPYGFLALQVYRTRKHVPTFCHESVVMRAIRCEDNKDILKAVLPFYSRMVKNEIEKREKYRRLSGRHCNEKLVTQRSMDTAIQVASYKCALCKTIPYLSRVSTESDRHYCTECAVSSFQSSDDRIYGIFETLFSDNNLRQMISDTKKTLSK